MSIQSCLPEYFAIQEDDAYYLYQNTLYQSAETNHEKISVIWPVANATFGHLTYYVVPTTTKKITTSRKWIQRTNDICIWNHAGKEIDIKKANGHEVTIPVILIDYDHNVLPYNDKKMKPSAYIPGIQEQRRARDIIAKLYREDPVNTVPSAASARDRVYPLQVAQPLQQDTIPIAPVISKPPTVASGIPHHVKKLLVTDMISRKECCPISSEDITYENAGVTSCGHVFVLSEIQKWLSMTSSKGLCPMCKEQCTV